MHTYTMEEGVEQERHGAKEQGTCKYKFFEHIIYNYCTYRKCVNLRRVGGGQWYHPSASHSAIYAANTISCTPT